MTPQEFKKIRLKLGLSIESLAKKLGGRPKWQVDLDDPYHMNKPVVIWK